MYGIILHKALCYIAKVWHSMVYSTSQDARWSYQRLWPTPGSFRAGLQHMLSFDHKACENFLKPAKQRTFCKWIPYKKTQNPCKMWCQYICRELCFCTTRLNASCVRALIDW